MILSEKREDQGLKEKHSTDKTLKKKKIKQSILPVCFVQTIVWKGTVPHKNNEVQEKENNLLPSLCQTL